MWKKKSGLSLEDHKRYAEQIRPIYRTLQSFYGEIGNKLPVKSKAFILAEKAKDAVDKLRCELDEILTRDYYHNQKEEVEKIPYYGSYEGDDRLK